jgi:hypothetical protein
MNEYYFLTSLLPPLEIGHVPALGYAELKKLLDVNLTSGDKKKVRTFLSLIDFENMRAFWSHERFDPRGNLTEAQMEQALQDRSWPWGADFPDFLIDYLDKYHEPAERLRHFPFLIAHFFAQTIEEQEGFLGDYFSFQREMRLVLVGFRAKKHGKDISAELQYEDELDPIVAQILAQKDAKDFEPPFEYRELKPIFEAYSDSPLDLYRAVYEYQFSQIVQLWGGQTFSIDRILNYMSRLLLVERWLELDVQKGIQVVDTIEKDIS